MISLSAKTKGGQVTKWGKNKIVWGERNFWSMGRQSVMSNPFEILVDSQKRRQHFLKTAPDFFDPFLKNAGAVLRDPKNLAPSDILGATKKNGAEKKMAPEKKNGATKKNGAKIFRDRKKTAPEVGGQSP